MTSRLNVRAIYATGELNSTTTLHGDGVWRAPAGGGSSSAGGRPVAGHPYGTAVREYAFASDVQGWTADGGTLSWDTAGRLKHQVAAATTQYTILEPSSAGNVANGEFTVDLSAVANNAANIFEFSIVFRAADASNHYMVTTRLVTSAYASTDKAVELYKKVGGVYTSLGSGAGASSDIRARPVNGKIRFRGLVRFVDEHIELYVNEQLVGAWNDTTHSTGRCGMRHFAHPGQSTQTVTWDNAAVFSLPSGWVRPPYSADPTTGGSAAALDDLTDVDTTTTTPTDGQALLYDSAAGLWLPGTVATGGAMALDGLTDVDTTTVPPAAGDALLFDGTTWEPGAVPQPIPAGTAQSSLPISWRGVGRNVDQDRTAGWLVRGINLGLGPNTIDTRQVWGAAWDWAGHIKPNLDRIISLGANSVRIQGGYAAYAANPSQFKTRFQQVMDYCAAANLKVLYAFLNNVDDSNAGVLASSQRTNYSTMIVDLATPYAGADFLLGWDIGNELMLDTSSDLVTLATNFRTDLRAVDSTTKITCSVRGDANGLLTAGVTAADAVVDFHDVHIYTVPNLANGWFPNWLDDIKALTTKPLLFAEFGANMATSGGVPNLPYERAQANFISSFLKYAGDPTLMGFMVWAIQDDSSTYKFGLYDAAGTPRRALAAWTAFPDRRDSGAVAAAVVTGRHSPVVLDNFARADAATVGAPPIGPAPTAVTGTWSIQSKVARVTTNAAGGHNLLVWDAKTADCMIEAEANINNPAHNVGIVFRFVDASNYWLAQFLQDAGGRNIKLYKNVAGTFTLISSTASHVQSLATPRVVTRRDKIFVYERDHLALSTSDAQHNTATKHGLYTYGPGDTTAAYWHKLAIHVPLRSF